MISRRQFIKAAGASAAALAISPEIVLASSAESYKNIKGANDKVNVAFIGIGQKGQEEATYAWKTGLCNVLAICDVNMGHPWTQPVMNMFPNAKRYTDFRVLFDEMASKLDAVFVCVRGYVALQEMAEKYPDSFIGLAYHTDDEMSDIENAQEIIDILDNPLPTGAVNRNTQTIFNCEPETLEDYIQDLKNLALADIRGEVTVLDADTTAVKVNTYTEFAADATQPFAIAYVVLENGVGPYVQANNFSGADYEFYGYEKLGRHVVLVYNDVVRSVYGGAAGVEGSVPSEIHQGQTYEYQYELPLPSNVKCKSNIEVVALLMNQENGQIVNACKCSFNKNADAISTLKPANPGKSVAVYNVGGAQLNAPQRGLNLVKMSDGSVGKIVK